MVVAQLVERSPLTPEIRGSNPVLGNTCIEHLFTVNCVEKSEKEAGNGPFFKKYLLNKTFRPLIIILLLLTEFEPESSDFGSSSSDNCATTTTQFQ